jgi:hypothetical protein
MTMEMTVIARLPEGKPWQSQKGIVAMTIGSNEK